MSSKVPIDKVDGGFMNIASDEFAGILDGWLLGLTPVDFILPVGLIVWLVLLYTLPLYNLDRNHTIGGLMFSIFFAAFGALICLAPQQISGVSFDPRISFVVTLFFIMMSISRWNRKIYANAAVSVSNKGAKRG